MEVSLGKFAPYAKTVAAFIALLVPFLTVLATALTDGRVSIEEGIAVSTAAGALVAGTKAVYQVKNKKAS